MLHPPFLDVPPLGGGGSATPPQEAPPGGGSATPPQEAPPGGGSALPHLTDVNLARAVLPHGTADPLEGDTVNLPLGTEGWRDSMGGEDTHPLALIVAEGHQFRPLPPLGEETEDRPLPPPESDEDHHLPPLLERGVVCLPPPPLPADEGRLPLLGPGGEGPCPPHPPARAPPAVRPSHGTGTGGRGHSRTTVIAGGGDNHRHMVGAGLVVLAMAADLEGAALAGKMQQFLTYSLAESEMLYIDHKSDPERRNRKSCGK